MNAGCLSHPTCVPKYLKLFSPIGLCLAGCFSVTPLGRDDFNVVSEQQLFRLNAAERLQFLCAHEDTRIVVRLDSYGSESEGIGITRLHVPADRWTPERPKDASAIIVRPDDNSARPGFVVLLPQGRGAVIAAGKRDSLRLLRCRAGRFEDWPLPKTETPLATLFASAWIADRAGFFLIGLERNSTLTLWEVTLGRDPDAPVFQEKAMRRVSPQDKMAWGVWWYSGTLFWSPRERALYAVCLPKELPARAEAELGTRVVRISPDDLKWSLIAPAHWIYGISERGLVFGMSHYMEALRADISEIRVRTVPDAQEECLVRVRGTVGPGCLSPDGKYVVFTNQGFLHDPLDQMYGPTICILWDFGSAKGFVVDTSHGIAGVLAWISTKEVRALVPDTESEKGSQKASGRFSG